MSLSSEGMWSEEKNTVQILLILKYQFRRVFFKGLKSWPELIVVHINDKCRWSESEGNSSGTSNMR